MTEFYEASVRKVGESIDIPLTNDELLNLGIFIDPIDPDTSLPLTDSKTIDPSTGSPAIVLMTIDVKDETYLYATFKITYK